MSHCVTNHLGTHCFTRIDVQGVKLVRLKKKINKTTFGQQKRVANKKHLANKTIALQYIYIYLHVYVYSHMYDICVSICDY